MVHKMLHLELKIPKKDIDKLFVSSKLIIMAVVSNFPQHCYYNVIRCTKSYKVYFSCILKLFGLTRLFNVKCRLMSFIHDSVIFIKWLVVFSYEYVTHLLSIALQWHGTLNCVSQSNQNCFA